METILRAIGQFRIVERAREVEVHRTEFGTVGGCHHETRTEAGNRIERDVVAVRHRRERCRNRRSVQLAENEVRRRRHAAHGSSDGIVDSHAGKIERSAVAQGNNARLDAGRSGKRNWSGNDQPHAGIIAVRRQSDRRFAFVDHFQDRAGGETRVRLGGRPVQVVEIAIAGQHRGIDIGFNNLHRGNAAARAVGVAAAQNRQIAAEDALIFGNIGADHGRGISRAAVFEKSIVAHRRLLAAVIRIENPVERGRVELRIRRIGRLVDNYPVVLEGNTGQGNRDDVAAVAVIEVALESDVGNAVSILKCIFAIPDEFPKR